MNLSLKAEIREKLGRQSRQVREKGWVPAVLYGKGFDSQNLEIEYNPFVKVLRQAGYSSLVDLDISDKGAVKVLIQDIQKDPISDRVIHVDFHQVNLTEKIEARIALKFIGEAPGVKELHGVLVKNLTELKVKALPQDLASEIEVDISPLKTFNDYIHVKDIKLPQGIEVMAKPEEIVVKVIEFVEEVETPVVAEAEAVAKVGVVEKKKAEEEGEEGAEAVGGEKKGAKEAARAKEAAPAEGGKAKNKK